MACHSVRLPIDVKHEGAAGALGEGGSVMKRITHNGRWDDSIALRAIVEDGIVGRFAAFFQQVADLPDSI